MKQNAQIKVLQYELTNYLKVFVEKFDIKCSLQIICLNKVFAFFSDTKPINFIRRSISKLITSQIHLVVTYLFAVVCLIEFFTRIYIEV